MDNGAVRTSARDGIEADILERTRRPAEFFELFHRVDLGERALWRLARKPGQEARERLAVADMRLPRARELHLVLAGFGQLTRIGRTYDAGARLFQSVEY